MDSKFELFRQRAFKILSAAGFDVKNILVSQYDLILEAELKNVFDEDSTIRLRLRLRGLLFRNMSIIT